MAYHNVAAVYTREGKLIGNVDPYEHTPSESSGLIAFHPGTDTFGENFASSIDHILTMEELNKPSAIRRAIKVSHVEPVHGIPHWFRFFTIPKAEWQKRFSGLPSNLPLDWD